MVTSCSSKNTVLEQKFRSELSPCPDPPNRIRFWPGPCSETQRQSYKICKETLSFIHCKNIPTEIINPRSTQIMSWCVQVPLET